MPTYRYQFKKTGNTIDLFQNMSDEPKSRMKNPKTGKVEAVERLISGGTGLMFKGGGWAHDSYGLKSSKSKSSSEACTSNPSTCQKPGCPSAQAS